VAGVVLGNATPLGLMAGALVGHGGGNAEAADCGAALALVRGSAGGPAVVQPAAGQPAPAAAPAPAPQQQKPQNPANLLRQLFR
jgi:hypothetical protein